MENNNNMNKERIKRFGEITVLDIDKAIEGGYIRICNEDDYINSIIVSIYEIRSLSILSSIYHYVSIDTEYNSFRYNDKTIEICGPLVGLIFTRKDFMAFGDYIYELVNGESAYGE